MAKVKFTIELEFDSVLTSTELDAVKDSMCVTVDTDNAFGYEGPRITAEGFNLIACEQ